MTLEEAQALVSRSPYLSWLGVQVVAFQQDAQALGDRADVEEQREDQHDQGAGAGTQPDRKHQGGR